MKENRFTLIEILIAMVILALTLGVTLMISGHSKDELIRAHDRWLIQHALEQATEFYLVADPKDLSLPRDLLSDGFRANCHVDIVDKGLPEYAQVDDYRGWVLAAYTITIFDSKGKMQAQQTINKLMLKDLIN